MADDDIKRLEKWQDEYISRRKSLWREKSCSILKWSVMKQNYNVNRNRIRMFRVNYHCNEGGSCGKADKLVITKFDGSFTDWNRFGGQFSDSIKKSGIANVKFSDLKVVTWGKNTTWRRGTYALFQRYNRAKAILRDKYWKESEIVKAYSQKKILDLPVVTWNNSKYQRIQWKINILCSLCRQWGNWMAWRVWPWQITSDSERFRTIR